MITNKKIYIVILIIINFIIVIAFFSALLKILGNKQIKKPTDNINTAAQIKYKNKFLGEWKADRYGGGIAGEYKKVDNSFVVIDENSVKIINNGKEKIFKYSKLDTRESLSAVSNDSTKQETIYLYFYGTDLALAYPPIGNDGYATYYKKIDKKLLSE